jgi:hypothetical protein
MSQSEFGMHFPFILCVFQVQKIVAYLNISEGTNEAPSIPLIMAATDVEISEIQDTMLAKVKVKFYLCSINLVTRHEDVWRSGDMLPCVLNLDTRWK